MRHSLLALLLITALVAPAFARAAVVINEIAWMGSSANANAEWIELMNTDSIPVDLTGWKLTSSTGSPSITLAGSIAGDGYFLLERTSDASVPSVSADQIYTGALSNAGATLTLSDASGIQEDQVAGGANWAAVGGDNKTKDTAQRTTSGWETAAPTPKAPNAPLAEVSVQPSPAPASSNKKQRVETAANVSQRSYDTNAVSAPAAATEVAAAGAALPAEAAAPVSRAPISGLLRSPWVIGLLSVALLGAGAVLIL